jgi:hypothetical protein
MAPFTPVVFRGHPDADQTRQQGPRSRRDLLAMIAPSPQSP